MRNGLQYVVTLVCVIRYDASQTSCLQTTLRADLALHTEYFYVRGSVHRDSVLIRSNKMQQYAGIYLLQIYSTYIFRVSIAPIIMSSENCYCSPWYRS